MITAADTTDAVVSALREACATGEPLAVWAAARQLPGLTVASGYDPESEAELRQVPAIAVIPGTEGGYSGQPETVSVVCELRIPNRGMAADPAEGHLWPADIASLAKVVRTILVEAFAESAAPVSTLGVDYSVAAWPTIMAALTLQHQITPLLGGDMTL
jgi:hypothetical protein